MFLLSLLPSGHTGLPVQRQDYGTRQYPRWHPYYLQRYTLPDPELPVLLRYCLLKAQPGTHFRQSHVLSSVCQPSDPGLPEIPYTHFGRSSLLPGQTCYLHPERPSSLHPVPHGMLPLLQAGLPQSHTCQPALGSLRLLRYLLQRITGNMISDQRSHRLLHSLLQ